MSDDEPQETMYSFVLRLHRHLLGMDEFEKTAQDLNTINQYTYDAEVVVYQILCTTDSFMFNDTPQNLHTLSDVFCSFLQFFNNEGLERMKGRRKEKVRFEGLEYMLLPYPGSRLEIGVRKVDMEKTMANFHALKHEIKDNLYFGILFWLMLISDKNIEDDINKENSHLFFEAESLFKALAEVISVGVRGIRGWKCRISGHLPPLPQHHAIQVNGSKQKEVTPEVEEKCVISPCLDDFFVVLQYYCPECSPR